MKKILTLFFVSLLALGMTACKGKKETASSIAQKWCDLNAKAFKAGDGPEKEAAEKARKAFEAEMEAKYKDNQAFMEEIGKEVDKCENASEGRK